MWERLGGLSHFDPRNLLGAVVLFSLWLVIMIHSSSTSPAARCRPPHDAIAYAFAIVEFKLLDSNAPLKEIVMTRQTRR